MGIINSNEKVDNLLGIKLNKLKEKGKILKRNVKLVEQLLNNLNEAKETHKYICLSCIYGAFLGDSIGSCCEFSEASNENHKLIFTQEKLFLPGEITDDSEMALSAAFAYIDSLNNDHSKIQDYLYFYFCIWRNSGPKDIGFATNDALALWQYEDIKDTKFNPEEVKQINWNTLANGSLMRISTFIAFYYYSNINQLYDIIPRCFNDKNKDSENDDLNDEICNLYKNIYKELYKNVQITHPNYENGISCSVFTLMVLLGMITKDATKVYNLFKQISISKKFLEIDNELISSASDCQNKYKLIISDIETNQPIDVYKQMGYYMHAFKLSIKYLYKYPDMGKNNDKDLYYKIMCDICDYGGDTDTNCAIVGTMIGPLIGYKNFPKELFSTFINFIPFKRTQFISAFAYIYVNYLEQKILKNEKNITPNKINEKDKGFNYIAYNMIKEFLNNNYGLQKNQFL